MTQEIINLIAFLIAIGIGIFLKSMWDKLK